MIGSTNLATRPFRNERLPWLLAGLLMAAALVTTVLHARLVNRLLSGDEANTVRGVREDEAKVAKLETAVGSEPPLKLEASELTRLRAFKDLVDRRVFPWRRLLAELERTLSPDVRLTGISPGTLRKGTAGMAVHLRGEARTKDAAFSFAEALDAAPAFSSTAIRSLNEKENQNQNLVEFELDVAFALTGPTPVDPSNKPRPPSAATGGTAAAQASPAAGSGDRP